MLVLNAVSVTLEGRNPNVPVTPLTILLPKRPKARRGQSLSSVLRSILSEALKLAGLFLGTAMPFSKLAFENPI